MTRKSDNPIGAKGEIAERLDWLFKNVLHADNREYTYKEVEAGTTELGHKVASTYIWNLRQGNQTMPNWMVLRSLAQFFGVSITFFYDETTEEEREAIKIASRIQDSDVQEIALRSAILSSDERKTILELIRQRTKEYDEISL